MVLVVVVAFLAGLEGIAWPIPIPPTPCCLYLNRFGNRLLDCWHYGWWFTSIYCTGWANIVAAVAPDAALVSRCCHHHGTWGDFSTKGISVAQGVAIPLAVAGLSWPWSSVPFPLVWFTLPTLLLKRGVSKVWTPHFVALLLQVFVSPFLQPLVDDSCWNCQNCSWTNAKMALWWNANRWWYGCSRWLCHGYQQWWRAVKYGILCHRFCSCSRSSQLTLIALGAHVVLPLPLIHLTLSKKGGNEVNGAVF